MQEEKWGSGKGGESWEEEGEGEVGGGWQEQRQQGEGGGDAITAFSLTLCSCQMVGSNGTGGLIAQAHRVTGHTTQHWDLHQTCMPPEKQTNKQINKNAPRDIHSPFSMDVEISLLDFFCS